MAAEASHLVWRMGIGQLYRLAISARTDQFGKNHLDGPNANFNPEPVDDLSLGLRLEMSAPTLAGLVRTHSNLAMEVLLES